MPRNREESVTTQENHLKILENHKELQTVLFSCIFQALAQWVAISRGSDISA